jgi:pimeloyl-ACP methyl ester carboxylesterase
VNLASPTGVGPGPSQINERAAAPSPVWILLRGLTREAGHWGAFPDQWRSAWPGAKVVALDLPGNGRFWRERSPSRLRGYVASVRAQVQALGVLQSPGGVPPVAVLAMSMGAMVAVEWAREHPQELAAAVLINTSLRPFSPFYQRLRPGRYTTLLRLATGTLDAASAEQLVLQMTSQLAVSADAGLHARRTLENWVELRKRHPVSAANAWRQLLAAARYRAPPHSPSVPVLLLAGARDALVDPRCSHQLAARWQLPLREHAQAGHDLPLDDGPWVAQQLRDWWALQAPR